MEAHWEWFGKNRYLKTLSQRHAKLNGGDHFWVTEKNIGVKKPFFLKVHWRWQENRFWLLVLKIGMESLLFPRKKGTRYQTLYQSAAASDRGHTHILYGKPKTISVQERKKAITPLGISYKKKEVLGIVLGSVPPFFLALIGPQGGIILPHSYKQLGNPH